MKRKSIFKAIVALAIALAFVMPGSAAFANVGTVGLNDIEYAIDTKNIDVYDGTCIFNDEWVSPTGHITHDSIFQDGWPVELGFWSRNPVVEDLDSDGNKELIVGTGDGYLHVFHYNGTYFWGQPIKVGNSVTSPAIADLNNDGIPEIVVCVTNDFGNHFPNGLVYVFEPDGSQLDGWPVVLNGSIVGECSPSIGDIDNDGCLDIIIGTGGSHSPGGTPDIIYYKKIYAFRYNGSLVDGWPVELEGTLLPRSTPVLIDLDGDDRLEIIMGSLNYTDYHGSTHELIAFHGNGSIVEGFPFYCEYWNWAIAAGDVNNDGEIEILDHGYMIDEHGNPIDEWQIQQYVISHLAIADVNKDGFAEIIYGQGGTGKVMIVDCYGQPLENWPQITQNGDVVDGNPVVGDIDGDGDLEILIGSYYSNKLFAWHYNGSSVDGFPKITNGYHRKIELDDLDNDGDVELISCSGDGYVYVWDLEGYYNENSTEWPMFQHDARRSGVHEIIAYNKPPEIPNKPEGPTEGTIEIEYTFTSNTTDPDGDEIYYKFDWGDGSYSEWLGSYDSGETIEVSHSWDYAEIFDIKVKAKDDNGSIETAWSNPLVINITGCPELDIDVIKGGLFRVTAEVKNNGSTDAIGVNWSITLDGGLILFGKETNGEVILIPAGGAVIVRSDLIFGFGRVRITVAAEPSYGFGDEKHADGFVLGPFIFIDDGETLNLPGVYSGSYENFVNLLEEHQDVIWNNILEVDENHEGEYTMEDMIWFLLAVLPDDFFNQENMQSSQNHQSSSNLVPVQRRISWICLGGLTGIQNTQRRV